MTYSIPKQLVPVAGLPVLGHVLTDVAACGVTEVVVVTSPESQRPISKMLTEVQLGLDVSVLVQPEPRGLADAFSLALPFVGADECLLYLGDCVVTGGVSHMVDEHRTSGADATILVEEVDDPSRYGIVEFDTDGVITRLVEKPKDSSSRMAIVGAYVFSSGAGSVANDVDPSWRGELEITDAIQLIVDRGGTVRSSAIRGWWVDTGTVEDVLSANARLLKSIETRVEGSIGDCKVEGEVIIEAGATVVASTLIGPVVVASGAKVEAACIGPNVTIGRDTIVRGAFISDSIVMDRVRLEGARLVASLIGSGTIISDTSGHSELSLVVGADSVIGSGPASQSG